jgi:pimeloyl-ACP methyl ester carboxylesterase
MKHLLLLHGAIGAKDQFSSLNDALQSKFNIHTLNFSGHGGEPPGDEFSIETFAKDVLKYLSGAGIETIDIFGYSMGGYVALYLAKHYSDKVGKIFTLATKFNWSPEIAARETKMLNADIIAEKIPVFAKQLETRHRPSDWKVVLSKTADMMVAMSQNNPLKSEDFREIEHQVQIGVGDKDAMVTFEETVAVFRTLPNASLIVLPQTQHPLEKVDSGRLALEIEFFFR